MVLESCDFTFLFYDYETFGIHPALDKPSQFACIRTDIHFNIIDIPNEFFCFPPIDYFPNPESILITGISPNYVKKYGLNEFEFTDRIHEQFKRPNTCILGYNNIKFDDEFTRNIFYRNFFDPYEWSWKNGNSRWDILNVLRACYALRPKGINWPFRKNSDFPSFKLSDVSKYNNVKHYQAHSAISDVYATLQIAKLLKRRQPRLFNYFFKCRNKKQLLKIIDIKNVKPMIYVSQFFGVLKKNVGFIAPILWHPNNLNILIAFDLTKNFSIFIEYLINIKGTIEDYSQFFKRGIIFIYVNRCPILAPINVIKIKFYESFGIDFKLFRKNLSLIRNRIFLKKKLKVVIGNFVKVQYENIDLQLYSKLLSSSEKNIVKITHNFLKKCSFDIQFPFLTDRMKSLFFRCRARNYPNLLNETEKVIWRKYCNSVMTKEKISTYVDRVSELLKLNSKNFKNVLLLKDLLRYVRNINKKILQA
ncbi:hypothetical protein XW81_02575 [Buchnera aphidicola (Schlechtendalia chinensis)]|uniref:Exodeoxyribonuclease I n=1 Tax=Buchnera aphidicola subsp. Schlechtendalia chinensis TaxID=118110 RepID=A0A172WE58_BUCSC|nr:exodeoxyribonuclease I [Buchnera aphidicola]ANF17254.1 hypothetical protein XW81_02575 [Buchnera aphidicola (Schlechtendalia chinensis)]